MSSSLSRNSKVRKSFRLEITLEKSTVETSGSLETLKSDIPTSSEREFTNSKTWSSDPKLVKDAPSPAVAKKSSSSGNIAKSLISGKWKNSNRGSEKTMNHTDDGATNGASSSSQKTKTSPVTRIKTVIRSTKETIVEKLPGLSSKNSSKWLQRSRPRSVGASQRYGVHCNGNIHQRDPSLSPPRDRRSPTKVDRSRSFNAKSRVTIDNFVAKRCEVWERKSRDSSPERTVILPLDLPSSESDRKSLIRQRTVMLFEPKAAESTIPSKKQLLLDLNGRTPKGTPSQSKPAKPQLKPKRVNLFKRGSPVKPTEAHHTEPTEPEPEVQNSCPPTDERVVNGNQPAMGKTCSVHQEGSVIEDDYGIDVLKTGYDQYANCNGVTPSSPNHSSKDRSPDKRSAKYEKENQNVVLPKASKHRTTSNSSKTQEAVQSNGCVPNGVLTERLDKNLSNYELPSRYGGEVTKRQTVATLNGVKLVDTVIEGGGDVKKKEQTIPVDHPKIDDDVFENSETVDRRETVVTLNGVQLVEKEAEKDGYYFIDIVNRTQDELEVLSRGADVDLESELPEEASGRLRAAIGKTNLLTTKKFKQFRGLCDEHNQHMEGSKVPTSEDLAGFWDMVMIQVDDVKAMFEEIDTMRKNDWQSPKRPSQVKPPEVRTPSRKMRTKTRPKATTPNTKNSLKDVERAAKAKQQREEARRRLLAAKKAMRRRTLSDSLSDEVGVEIYC